MFVTIKNDPNTALDTEAVIWMSLASQQQKVVENSSGKIILGETGFAA